MADDDPAVQASRLRVNQVWRHSVDVDRFAMITGFTTGEGTVHTVEYLPVHRDDRPVRFPWQVQGEARTIPRPDFLAEFVLHWEAGNKELGGGTDLSGDLGKVRQLRREGKHEAAEQMVSRRTDVGELLHRNRELVVSSTELSDHWHDALDERVLPAAELLHVRRHALAEQMTRMQDEIDQIDAAIDALTKVESP